MVRDGIYYGLALVIVAALVAWLTIPGLAAIPLLLAAFFLWFFRDPERRIPAIQGAIVSPADGKVTSISELQENGEQQTRISIFLSVFDVHVNRSPVSGVIDDVRYQKGKFGNAIGAASAEENEQNIVTVRADAGRVVFKQIAGLLARRIVFTKNVGDVVERGERVGLIKFGSRTDVIFPATAEMKVRVGDRVKGGSTVAGSCAAGSSDAAAARCCGGAMSEYPQRHDDTSCASTARAQGSVPAAVDVHGRQHGRRLLCDFAGDSGHRERSLALRSGGQGDWICDCLRFLRRRHRAADEHGQRVWPGTGFARRCDCVWRRARRYWPGCGAFACCRWKAI